MPTSQIPGIHHHQVERFCTFPDFQRYIQATFSSWPQQVQQALRLIALNGITEPISEEQVPAQALIVAHANFRETLEHKGCLSRQRAVLLVVQELIAEGQLPPVGQIEVYSPEAVTAFGKRLEALFPHYLGSEYIPDASHPLRATVPHQDLCALTLGDGCVDLAIANELFEHLYNLPAALSEIARILRAGGYLVGTFPFAYNRYDTIVKARHRDGATPGVAAEAELLMEPEFHGNPVDPEQGSLVYQIPGWDLLDQARSAGLADPTIHWVASPSYGVVGQETPGVMVLTARKH